MRLISALLVIILISSLLVGCRRNDNSDDLSVYENGFDFPEYVYLSEVVRFPSFPEGKSNVVRVVYGNDKFFVVSNLGFEDLTEEEIENWDPTAVRIYRYQRNA
jgi:hypothetical protein